MILPDLPPVRLRLIGCVLDWRQHKKWGEQTHANSLVEQVHRAISPGLKLQALRLQRHKWWANPYPTAVGSAHTSTALLHPANDRYHI